MFRRWITVYFAALTAMVFNLNAAQTRTPAVLSGRIVLWEAGMGCLGWYTVYPLTARTADAFKTGLGADQNACLAELSINAQGDQVALNLTDPHTHQPMDTFIDSFPAYPAELRFTPKGKALAIPLKAVKDAQGHWLNRSALAISPDGRQVAFNSGNNDQHTTVLVRDRAGAVIATLPEASFPSWLPDQRLAVACGSRADPHHTQICIHTLGTKAVKRLLALPASAYRVRRANTYELSDLAVSPDGRWVAATVQPYSSPEGPIENTRVWLISTTGQPAVSALKLPVDTEPLINVSLPAWSPDGKFLALSVSGRLAFVDLATHRLVGQAQRVYGEQVQTRPVWIR